jgi:hypothetical protein
MRFILIADCKRETGLHIREKEIQQKAEGATEKSLHSNATSEIQSAVENRHPKVKPCRVGNAGCEIRITY